MIVFIFDFSPMGRAGWFRCQGCGVSVHQNGTDRHSCDPENVVTYQMSHFEDEWGDFLSTNAGRFELYYAGRDRV